MMPGSLISPFALLTIYVNPWGSLILPKSFATPHLVTEGGVLTDDLLWRG